MNTELNFCKTHLTIKRIRKKEEIELSNIKNLEIECKTNKCKIVFLILYIMLSFLVLYFSLYITTYLFIVYVLILYFLMFHALKTTDEFLIIKLKNNKTKKVKLSSKDLEKAIQLIDYMQNESFVRNIQMKN